MSQESLKHEAVDILLTCLRKEFEIYIDQEDYQKTIYSCERAEKYKNVYYIKLSTESDVSKLCALTYNSNRCHRGVSNRSYCVNIKTKKIMSNCFSTKCKTRNGGKYVFQDVDTSEEDESDEQIKKRQKR
jgi:hypothetical protein